MLKRMTILTLIAAGVVLAFSAGASGALTPEEEEVGHTAANPYTSPFGLSVRASNGYWVTVNSAKGGRVAVEASGAEGSVTYTAPGTVSETGIQADLGKYGQIDMQWVPSGRVGKSGRNATTKGL